MAWAFTWAREEVWPAALARSFRSASAAQAARASFSLNAASDSRAASTARRASRLAAFSAPPSPILAASRLDEASLFRAAAAPPSRKSTFAATPTLTSQLQLSLNHELLEKGMSWPEMSRPAKSERFGRSIADPRSRSSFLRAWESRARATPTSVEEARASSLRDGSEN